jgi:selenium metabolism protein YedF
MQTTIVIHSDTMGRGDDGLGNRLIQAFLRKLQVMESKPDTIILYNSAVVLAAEGSPILDALQELDRAGVEILSCGTCVQFFKLEDKIVAGSVSNMMEIATTLMESDRVVTI